MNHLIRGHHRTQCAALTLSLAILLGNLPMGLAGESATPTAPGADPSDVQERAVTRGQRQQELLQPAPAPAKGIDKSAVIRDQRTPPLSLPAQPAPSTGPTGPLPLVGGTFEPDFKYPWVVRMNGCFGVLIHPQWVLTAAHCVYIGLQIRSITYSRTDPNTGAVREETRAVFGPGGNSGVFIHPLYDDYNITNDIALIKLAQPFPINPYLQTVGVPGSSRRAGVLGTLASISHTESLPPGQLGIFREPIPPVEGGSTFSIPPSAASIVLCKGNSGSGIVTVENGRATVRGIASNITGESGCLSPNGLAGFTDVFTYRDWILQTMNNNAATLAVNTRLRWSGRTARGTMVVACFNPNGNLLGPLNVVGVEEGALCEAGQTQTVMCNLDRNQGNVSVTMMPTLSGLTMRTTINGVATVQTLPASGNTASFFGLLPAGASREFTCQIGTPLTAATGAMTGSNLAVMSRGVEGEQPMEPIVEQPSPFDQPEGTKP